MIGQRGLDLGINFPKTCGFINVIILVNSSFYVEKYPTHSENKLELMNEKSCKCTDLNSNDLSPVRPLFCKVDPCGKIGPIEVNLKGLHQTTHDVNDVHEPSTALDINVTKVIIGSHDFRNVIGSLSSSATTSVVFTSNASDTPNAVSSFSSATFRRRFNGSTLSSGK